MFSQGVRRSLAAVLFSLGLVASGPSAQAKPATSPVADACIVHYYYDNQGNLIMICYSSACPTPGCFDQ